MVRLANVVRLREHSDDSVLPGTHASLLLLGDQAGNTLCTHRITDASLLRTGEVSRTVTVNRVAEGDELSVNFISETWAGLDVQSCFVPRYSVLRPPDVTRPEQETRPRVAVAVAESGNQGAGARRPCLHHCTNKQACAHDCCKVGVREVAKSSLNPALVANKRRSEAMLQSLPIKRLSLQKREASSGICEAAPIARVSVYSGAPPACATAPPARHTPVVDPTTTLKTFSQFGFQCSRPKMQYNSAPQHDTPATDVNNNVDQNQSYTVTPANRTDTEIAKASETPPQSVMFACHSPSGYADLSEAMADISWEDCIDIEPNAVSHENLPSIDPPLNELRSSDNKRDSFTSSFGGPLKGDGRIKDNGLCNERRSSAQDAAVQGLVVQETAHGGSTNAEGGVEALYRTYASQTCDETRRPTKNTSQQDVATEPNAAAWNYSGICRRALPHVSDTPVAADASNRPNIKSYEFPGHLAGFKAFTPAVGTSVNKTVVFDHPLKSRTSLSLSAPSATKDVTPCSNQHKVDSNQRLATLFDQLKNEYTWSQKSFADDGSCSTPILVSTHGKTRAVASVTPKPRSKDGKGNDTPAAAVIGTGNDYSHAGDWVDLEKFAKDRKNEKTVLTELYGADNDSAMQRPAARGGTSGTAGEAGVAKRAEATCSETPPEVDSILSRLRAMQGSSISRNEEKYDAGSAANRNIQSALEKIIKPPTPEKDSMKPVKSEGKNENGYNEKNNRPTKNYYTISRAISESGAKDLATAISQENNEQATETQNCTSPEDSYSSGRRLPQRDTEPQVPVPSALFPSLPEADHYNHRGQLANLVTFYQQPQLVPLTLVNKCVNTQPRNLLSLYLQPAAGQVAAVGQHCLTSSEAVMGVYQQPLYMNGVCGPHVGAVPHFAPLQQHALYGYQVKDSNSVWLAGTGTAEQSSCQSTVMNGQVGGPRYRF